MIDEKNKEDKIITNDDNSTFFSSDESLRSEDIIIDNAIILKDNEQKSGKYQDIIGEVPHWMSKYGIFIFLCIFFIAGIGSFLLKDPDIISASIILTGKLPTSDIMAKTNGKITELYVENDQYIKVGDHLGVIENPAITGDVLEIKNDLLLLKNDLNISKSFSTRQMRLGSLQNHFTDFNKSLISYKNFNNNPYYTQKMIYIQERISQGETRKANILKQKEILIEQNKLGKNSFIRDSLLLERKSLSIQDYEASRKEYLQNELTLENLNSSYINLLSELNLLRESLLDVEKQYIDASNDLETNLTTSISQFLNEIKSWEMNYLLISPVEGKVTFTKYWSINQNVSGGDKIFSIIPNQPKDLVAKALISTSKAGKVKIGQEVNIYFSNYPYDEFGIIKGVVKSISLVPSDSKYTLEILLKNGLNTSYGKELPYTQDMEGDASIITEDIRLIERLFMPIKGFINKKIANNE